jgi:sugar (pentulose or hexulose) kinase
VTELLLGIDVGTSACKAAVVDADGASCATARRRRRGSGADRARGRPDALLGRVVAPRARRSRGARGPRGRHRRHERGRDRDAARRRGTRPAPAIAWHDARGAPRRRRSRATCRTSAQRTGLPASALCSLAKLKHLAIHGAARWLNVAEWIVHRLGGRQVSELSLSSRTGLLDLDPRAPYADALAWADLPGDLLAEAVLAGTDAGRSDGAAVPGTEGAVLTVAGHDHVVAGLGVGVIAPGDVLDSCGTAEAIVRVAPPLDAAARRRSVAGGVTVGWHVAQGRQALLAGLWSGLALREVLDGLGIGESDREELSAGALAIAPATRLRSSSSCTRWSARAWICRPPRPPPCGARRSMRSRATSRR